VKEKKLEKDRKQAQLTALEENWMVRVVFVASSLIILNHYFVYLNFLII